MPVCILNSFWWLSCSMPSRCSPLEYQFKDSFSYTNMWSCFKTNITKIKYFLHILAFLYPTNYLNSFTPSRNWRGKRCQWKQFWKFVILLKILNIWMEIYEWLKSFCKSLIRKTNLGFLDICVSNLINKAPHILLKIRFAWKLRD